MQDKEILIKHHISSIVDVLKDNNKNLEFIINLKHKNKQLLL